MFSNRDLLLAYICAKSGLQPIQDNKPSYTPQYSHWDWPFSRIARIGDAGYCKITVPRKYYKYLKQVYERRFTS